MCGGHLCVVVRVVERLTNWSWTGAAASVPTLKLWHLSCRCAFVPFLCAGDPDMATTEAALRKLDALGADVIELGVPYSDPLADGPVIQESATRALKAGATLDTVLEMVSRYECTRPAEERKEGGKEGGVGVTGQSEIWRSAYHRQAYKYRRLASGGRVVHSGTNFLLDVWCQNQRAPELGLLLTGT
jgi:hypothetical protein